MSTDSTNQARQCLECLRSEVNAAFSHLKALCSEDGRLSPKLLDEQQKVSYELAFCVAEIEASIAMLNYATETKLKLIYVNHRLYFCAESIRTVWQRLFNHAHELGLDDPNFFS